ncbi:MAG: SDR family oxidoreductase, partial [Candidatus Dadabacteria bacterium]
MENIYMCDFKKRIAIVTGASSGIGEAIATSLVEAGTQVVINARRAKRLAALEDRLNGKAGKIISVAGDASDERVVEKLLDTAREGFGRDPDLIVANAGRGLKGSVLTSDKSKWLEMYRIN